VTRVEIGIGTWNYTYIDDLDVWETFGQIAAAGFDGVELDGERGYFGPDDFTDQSARTELLRRLRDKGLKPAGYNAPPLDSRDATGCDAGARSSYRAAMLRHIEHCAGLGIATMRLDTGAPPAERDDHHYRAAMARLIEVWAAAAEDARAHGVTLVWEFEPGFVFNRPSDVTTIVEGVDSEAFTVLLDTCHAHMVAVEGARQPDPGETLAGGIVEMIERLAGKIGLVHLIDSDGTIHDEFTSTHVPLGMGVLDARALVESVAAAGYEGPWWTVDLCFWPDPMVEAAGCAKAARAALAGGLPSVESR